MIFGPKPRTYVKRMNNKEVKLAMRSALSAKLRDNELVLVDDYGFEKPSTPRPPLPCSRLWASRASV